MSTRAEHIRKILLKQLKPASVEVTDDSARHAGHAGARESGGGHFTIQIVAECFTGCSRLQRHRLVNNALKEEFGPMIHALSIQTDTPEEI